MFPAQTCLSVYKPQMAKTVFWGGNPHNKTMCLTQKGYYDTNTWDI